MTRCWLLVLAACGERARPAPPPRPPDPAALAQQLHADIDQLAAIAHRRSDECAPLIAELDAHVRVMEQHAADARAMAADPARGRELKQRLAAFPAPDSDAIARDLAAGYLACGARKEELRAIIDRIPDYSQSE